MCQFLQEEQKEQQQLLGMHLVSPGMGQVLEIPLWSRVGISCSLFWVSQNLCKSSEFPLVPPAEALLILSSWSTRTFSGKKIHFPSKDPQENEILDEKLSLCLPSQFFFKYYRHEIKYFLLKCQQANNKKSDKIFPSKAKINSEKMTQAEGLTPSL